MKRKGSAKAKFAAWIGMLTSGVLFFLSIAGVYTFYEFNIYDSTEEEYRTSLYEKAARNYAAMALGNMETPSNDKFLDTNYRYGIIEAETLKGLDLNSDSTYVERNFTETISEEDLYAQFYEIAEGESYGFSGSLLFGNYTSSASTAAHRVEEEIYDIYYNISDGIFYYLTAGGYYPVKQVALRLFTGTKQEQIYRFQYDFEKKMYQNLSKQETSEYTAEESEENAVGAESEGTGTVKTFETRAEVVLNQEYLTLDQLDNTSENYYAWTEMSLDGQIYDERSSVNKMMRDLTDEVIPDEAVYYLEAANKLRVYYVQDAPKYYWVVAILPQEVEFGYSSDMFVQANTLVTIAYGLRYSIFFFMLIFLVISIALFSYLISAAGHRRGTEKIVETWMDKIPFDIYLCCVFALESIFLTIINKASYHIDQTVLYYIAVIFMLFLICILAVMCILSFAVRVKKGEWWKNTIIYKVLHCCKKAVLLLWRNIGMLWKVLLVMGLFIVGEFIVLVWYHTHHYNPFIVLLGLWFAEKIVLTAVVLVIVLQMIELREGGRKIASGDLSYQIDTGKLLWEFKQHGDNLNSIGNGMSRAVDERLKSERFKTELITNVSHDIKTPLTSIINYVDLLEKEELNNERADEYLEVLERQSARLKKLIEDLMEASKASTGNLTVHMEQLEAGIFLVQTVGEFEEKTKARGLELRIAKPEEPVYIMADSRHFWRVIDNLMNNICKYAQPQTRVYINMEVTEEKVIMTFRNTSFSELNISSEELMERFVRGDSSRNTEGSGLGLSIAKSLMELMKGTFTLQIDGDLFKVILSFDKSTDNQDI